MNNLSKTLLISGLSGILVLSGCSKGTVKNDTIYKVEGNSTVLSTSGTAINGEPQALENKTKVPNLDNGGLLSQTEIQDLLKKTSGTWVNEIWISNLKKTKSIINSTCAMPTFLVSKGNSGLFQLDGSTDDLHQGMAYYTSTNDVYKVTDINTSNKFFKVKVDNAYNSDVLKENKKDEAFILISNNTDKIEYYYGDIKRSFIRIGNDDNDLKKYINNITIAGKYVDEKGASYNFTNDGYAIWPNSKEKYQVSLEAVYSGYDNIAIGDFNGNKYLQHSYEIKDKMLYLYKSHTKAGTDFLLRDEKTPFLTLKKIDKTESEYREVVEQEHSNVEKSSKPESTKTVDLSDKSTPIKGLDNDQYIKQIDKLKKLIEDGNKAELAKKIVPLQRQYPVPDIKTEAEFIARYDQVFDDKLVKAIIHSSSKYDWTEISSRYLQLNSEYGVWLDLEGNIIKIDYVPEKGREYEAMLLKEMKENLHSTLHKFISPELYMETKGFKVRIDKMDTTKYRYASWGINKSTKEEPDFVIENGVIESQGSGGNHTYVFTRNSYKYKVDVVEVGSNETDLGTFLLVEEGEKLLMKEKVITLYK